MWNMGSTYATCEQFCVRANLDLPGLLASVTPADKQDLLVLQVKFVLLRAGFAPLGLSPTI